MFTLFALYSYLSSLALRLDLLAYFFIGSSDTPATRVIWKAGFRLMLESLDRDVELDLHLADRSEEHTSELQSRSDLVCRLLLEKKKQPTCGPRSGIEP